MSVACELGFEYQELYIINRYRCTEGHSGNSPGEDNISYDLNCWKWDGRMVSSSTQGCVTR